MAWLNAAPDVEHTGKGKKPEPVARLKTMEAQGKPVLLPDNPAPHITDWLFEIGPSSGEGPISWEAIDAWCNRTGVDLDPWESKTIRSLSKSFLNQQYLSRKPDCPAPYSNEQPKEVQDRVADQFKAMVAAFGGRS